MTNRESFENLPDWLERIREYSDEHVKVALVANKKDLVEDREYNDEFRDVILDTEGQNEANERKKQDKLGFRLESLMYEGGDNDSP